MQGGNKCWCCVGQTQPDNPSGPLGTRAVCIAVIWALTVLRAGVPTPALVNLFSWLAHLGQPVEHIALAATKLVGLLKKRYEHWYSA